MTKARKKYYAECKKACRSTDHVASGCSKLAQKEYKIRHDHLGRIGNFLESVILKLEISGMNMSLLKHEKMF